MFGLQGTVSRFLLMSWSCIIAILRIILFQGHQQEEGSFWRPHVHFSGGGPFQKLLDPGRCPDCLVKRE